MDGICPVQCGFSRVALTTPLDGGPAGPRRRLVGEDAHHVGAPLDLAVEPFERVVGPDLPPVLAGEAQVARASASASSMRAATLGKRPRKPSATLRYCSLVLGASGCH